MKTLIGIQARSNSTRFPKKIYAQLQGKSLLEHCWDRCKVAEKNSRKIDDVQVLVLAPYEDKELGDFCIKHRMEWQHPECLEDDLIKRYLLAARSEQAEKIVRITSDCPLIDPALILDAIARLDDHDYVSNTIFRTYPDGLDVQACTIQFLEWVDKEQTEGREHPFLDYDMNLKIRGTVNWKSAQLLNPMAYAVRKISIDTEEDLRRLEQAYEEANKRMGGEKQISTGAVTYGNQQ